MIHALQILRTHTLNETYPSLLPSLISLDAKAQDIILQFIHFFEGKAGKIRPKETEHTLIGEVLLCHIEKAPDIFYEGIQKHTPLVIHECRYLIQIKRPLKIISVHIHIAYDHADLPVTHPLFAHQTPDLPRRGQRFLPGIPGGVDAQRVCFLVKCSGSVAEQVLLQERKRFVTAEPIYRLFVSADRFFYLNSALSRQRNQCSHHMLAERK